MVDTVKLDADFSLENLILARNYHSTQLLHHQAAERY